MTTALSMRTRGRLAGAAYLGIFLAGLIYMNFIPDTGLLTTDWGGVVDHILVNQIAFWIGFPFFLLSIVFRLVFLQLAYGLFRGVNDGVNRLGVFVYLVGAALQLVMAVYLMAPVVLFNGPEYRAAFAPDQLHAMATLALQLYILTYNVALAFFGLYSLLLGYLMVRSSLVPRAVGVCIMFSGLGWLTFFVPLVAAMLLPYNLIIGLSGEAVIILWLLVMGVNPNQPACAVDTTPSSTLSSSSILQTASTSK